MTDFGHAHAIDKHLCYGRVQFVATTMIAFKQLRVITPPCPRNGQILDATYARFQIARVVPIALISTLMSATRTACRSRCYTNCSNAS